jgi:hypothetical protein
MIQRVPANPRCHLISPLHLPGRTPDDYILALAFIYRGMEQAPFTMPEEPEALWAWALDWVDAGRSNDDAMTLAEAIQYLQDILSRQFLPEGRYSMHVVIEDHELF